MFCWDAEHGVIIYSEYKKYVYIYKYRVSKDFRAIIFFTRFRNRSKYFMLLKNTTFKTGRVLNVYDSPHIVRTHTLNTDLVDRFGANNTFLKLFYINLDKSNT